LSQRCPNKSGGSQRPTPVRAAPGGHLPWGHAGPL